MRQEIYLLKLILILNQTGGRQGLYGWITSFFVAEEPSK